MSPRCDATLPCRQNLNDTPNVKSFDDILKSERTFSEVVLRYFFTLYRTTKIVMWLGNNMS